MWKLNRIAQMKIPVLTLWKVFFFFFFFLVFETKVNFHKKWQKKSAKEHVLQLFYFVIIESAQLYGWTIPRVQKYRSLLLAPPPFPLSFSFSHSLLLSDCLPVCQSHFFFPMSKIIDTITHWRKKQNGFCVTYTHSPWLVALYKYIWNNVICNLQRDMKTSCHSSSLFNSQWNYTYIIEEWFICWIWMFNWILFIYNWIFIVKVFAILSILNVNIFMKRLNYTQTDK